MMVVGYLNIMLKIFIGMIQSFELECTGIAEHSIATYILEFE